MWNVWIKISSRWPWHKFDKETRENNFWLQSEERGGEVHLPIGELDHGHVQMHFGKSVGEFVRIRQKIAGPERHHNELVSHLQSGSFEKSTLIQKIKGSPFRRVIFTFCVKLFISSLKKCPNASYRLWKPSLVQPTLVQRQLQTEADGRHAARDTSGSGLTTVAALHIMETFPRSDALADTAGGRRLVFVRLREPALTRCKCQQHPSKRRSARSADL